MLKCSKEAFARCPFVRSCGSLDKAIFLEGSDCDRFNQEVVKLPVTNAEHIRAMSDEELAEMIINISCGVEPCNYCSPQQTFGQDCGVHSVCRDGVIAWLRQPANLPSAASDFEIKQHSGLIEEE